MQQFALALGRPSDTLASVDWGSREAARVHHVHRWRGGCVAARRPSTNSTEDPAGWLRFQRHSHDWQARLRGISARAQRAGLRGRANNHTGSPLGGGRYEHYPGLLAELVGLKVDVLVVTNSEATRVAMKATRSIPIVMFATDPAKQGLVTSLSHPGGNVTGLSFYNEETSGKRLQ